MSAAKTPDAAGAFELASGLEDAIRNIECATEAFLIIGQSTVVEDGTRKACFVLAETLETAIEEVHEAQRQLSSKLWAYKHAPNTVPERK